jgi:hypothetical protein
MTNTRLTLRAALAALAIISSAGQALAYERPPEPLDFAGEAIRTSTYNSDWGWYWVPIKGSKCRFDEPDANPNVKGPANSGIAVRYNPNASKILITMQGGGACFNGVSCAGNSSRFGFFEFNAFSMTDGGAGTKLNNGIWNLGTGNGVDFHPGDEPHPHPINKLDDYTQVFIPYCTGDFHAGDNKATTLPGVVWPGTLIPRPINFAGYRNTGLYFDYILKQLVPAATAPLQEILLSGFSAGAFGATVNAPRLRKLLDETEGLANVKLSVLSDSGPFFSQRNQQENASSNLMTGCVQNRWHSTWGLSTILATCPKAPPGVTPDPNVHCTSDNWLFPFFRHTLTSLPNVPFALTSTYKDGVIADFMGTTFSGIGCGRDPVNDEYQAGLKTLRATMQNLRPSGNTSTLFMKGTEHCSIHTPRYFTATELAPNSAGTTVQTWAEHFQGLLSGTPNYLHLSPPVVP